MKSNRNDSVLFFAMLLAFLLLTLFVVTINAQGGDSDNVSPKVSGLLDYHMTLKKTQLAEPSQKNLDRMNDLGLQTDNLTRQSVFIYFDEFPTKNQIAELKALGVTLLQDTWIPPVGDHPTGFMIANIPIDNVYAVADKVYVTYLNTAEETYEPTNDLGTVAMKATNMWNLGYDGSGVTIAVIDSGIDLTHADIPTPIAAVDYSNTTATIAVTDTTIANLITGHGTHVAASALGRGVYTTTYRGAAPGADLVFLKIGNDTTSRASTAAIIAAIRDAVDVYNADIITMSYGGWSTYMDGTSAAAQAVDYAYDQGAVVFISAGNDANEGRHFSDTIAGNSTSGYVQVNVGSTTSPNQAALLFNLIWSDGIGVHNDLDLEIYDSNYNQITTTTTEHGESTRGTESDYTYSSYITGPATYYLRVINNSSDSQFFHIYSLNSWITFDQPDPFYTVESPATANNAIAVGAYVTRQGWIDWQGHGWQYNNATLYEMSDFSSQGPRVDEVKKPNISAPGQGIISALDANYASFTGNHAIPDSRIISDNGTNDGTQPHHYTVMQGTSMATPLTAGAAALLLDKYPDLKGHPDLIRHRIQDTASNNGLQTNTNGYGYLDILKAAKLIKGPTTSDSAYAGKYNSPSKMVVTIFKPKVGLNINDITVEIGGIQANIVTLYEGDVEYVLEIIPPNQTANGLYDLTTTVTVSGGAVSETEPNAVLYSDTNNVDAVLVIDRSGSMGSSDYMEPAKDAAKQFVDFMYENDQIGVVSFSSSANVEYGLAPITVGTGNTVFSDDMESGSSKWTAVSPWAVVTDTYHSAGHAWNINPNSVSLGSIDASLTSNAFSLSSLTQPTLRFWTRYDYSYDNRYVEISIDGGSTWTRLANYYGSNTQSSWTQKIIDLNAYVGQDSVQIRFRFDDYLYSYSNWYIDDVEVVPGSSKDSVKAAIDNITDGGTTAIGGGLQVGQNELTTEGDTTHPWSIILLSDGYENVSPYVAEVLPDIRSTKTVIHTIALGPNSDEVLLMDIAAQTNGTYHNAPTGQDLAGIYNTIVGAVSGQQTLFSESGVAQQGVTSEKDVVVDSTVSEATFSVIWSNSANDIILSLRKPNGDVIDANSAASDPNIDYVAGATYKYYRVMSNALTSGVWTMQFTGGSTTRSGENTRVASSDEVYTARVVGQAGLTLQTHFDHNNYLTTQPVKISASLSDNQPILGSTVFAEVNLPSSTSRQLQGIEWIEANGDTMPQPSRAAQIRQTTASTVTLTLYDDGNHNDGMANDGVYANTLSGFNTQMAGTYSVMVSASGTSNNGDQFARHNTDLLYVAQNSHSELASVYLPLVLKSYGGSSSILSGTVTDDGYSVSGTELLLRYYDGSAWSTYATTTTDSSGNYQFTNLPSLSAGQYFYVRWYNTNYDSSRLYTWGCWSITSSTTDPNAYQCDFDLEDVALVSPSHGASVSLPHTFYWNTRGITTDDYEFNIADLSDYDPYGYISLGYVGSYTLNGLPTGFSLGEEYGWWMWVYGPDGYGTSYYYRNVTFSSTNKVGIQDIPTFTLIPKDDIETIAPPQAK